MYINKNKYVINRKDVCAGILKRTNFEHTFKGVPIKYNTIIRTMLFKVVRKKYAKDLIYTTPTKYPIENFTNKKINNLVIQDYLELEDILKYLEFNECLT